MTEDPPGGDARPHPHPADPPRRRGGPFYEAYTAHHHLRAVAGLGVLSGIFSLNAEFARGSLGATRWHVLALLLIPSLSQSLTVFFNPLDPHRGLVRHPFRTVAAPVHLLLLLPLLGLLPAGATPFVALVVLCSVVQMLLVPVQNGILARNYGLPTRGRRIGLASAVQGLAIVLVSVPAGWLLDTHGGPGGGAPGSAPAEAGGPLAGWRVVYAVAAVAAVLAYLQWSRLRRRRLPPLPAGQVDHASPFAALRRDRRFLAFEACFMVYGLGFLMLMPVLPLYLIDELQVDYVQVGLAKGVLFHLVGILAAPVLGRVLDRVGVLRIAGVAFGLLALFPLTLLVVPGLVGLYVGYALFGIAMSGVTLAWTLGPMLLAGRRNPSPYLNAHLGLVGIRALVGMVGATALQQALGTRVVFGVVIVLEIAAVLGMTVTARMVARRPAGA